MGSVPNERVARELVPLLGKPKELKAAWSAAVKEAGDRPPIAREVVDAIYSDGERQPEQAPQPEPTPQPARKPGEIVEDWPEAGGR